MEFPIDIWREIMGFIPMPYREPSHYRAMMGVDAFRNRRRRSNQDSFYMHLVATSWWYWSYPDVQHLMMAPEVVIRRGVATRQTKQEFVDIYDEYARHLSHIRYEI